MKSLTAKLSIIFTVITLVTCFTIAGTAIVFNRSIRSQMKQELYNTTLESYKTEIKTQVQSVISLTSYYYKMSQQGLISEDDAKTRVLAALRNTRYGDAGDGYFWVDDEDYKLVMHPILPEQEGSDRFELTDKNGVKIIQSIMKTALNGGGFNEFWFTKSDGVTVAPKVAYSEEFKPWGWIITTGIYSDDIQDIVNNSDGVKHIVGTFGTVQKVLNIESVTTILLMSLVSMFIIRVLVKYINMLKDGLEEAADNNLNYEFNEKLLSKKDELGEMARSTNKAVESFRNSIINVKNASNNVYSNSESINDITSSALEACTQVAEAIENTAADATNQVNAVEEVTSSIEVMKKDSDKMEVAMHGIGENLDELFKSSDMMKSTIEGMGNSNKELSEKVETISEQINKTDEAISKMADIIVAINGIADQTNLLALNASIEAAHAGDAGKGFGVVASSIKSLSQDTSNELEHIKGIIENLTVMFNDCNITIGEVIAGNNNNTESLDEVVNSFNEVFKAVERTNNRVSDVRELTSDMTKLMNNISEQAESIAKGAENTAAATEEITASSEELSALMQNVSENCKDSCKQVKELVNDLSKFNVISESE